MAYADDIDQKCLQSCENVAEQTGNDIICSMQTSTEKSQEDAEKDLAFNYAACEFRPIIEQFSYKFNQTIPVRFLIECGCEIKSLRSEMCGFEELQSPEYSKGYVLAKINVTENCDTLKYTVYATLSNGAVLEASIYGIIRDSMIYINGNSYFGAKDIYFAELVSKNEAPTEMMSHTFLGEEVTCIREESYTLNDRNMNSTANSNYDTYITGTLRWKDDSNNWHPLQFSKVTVCHCIGASPSTSDPELGTVYTDSNGVFNMGFTNISGGYNLYIIAYPAGETSVVKTGAGIEYAWPSSVTSGVSTSSTTVKNIDIDMSENIGRAFQISQAVIIAAKYAKTQSRVDITNVAVKYPHNQSNTGCFYSRNTIYIIGDRSQDIQYGGVTLHSYAAWDVIMHEYNHHVQRELEISANPGGWHVFQTDMYRHYMSHYNGQIYISCLNDQGNITCAHPSQTKAKEKAIGLTYAESWASVVGGMGQLYAISHWG